MSFYRRTCANHCPGGSTRRVRLHHPKYWNGGHIGTKGDRVWEKMEHDNDLHAPFELATLRFLECEKGLATWRLVKLRGHESQRHPGLVGFSVWRGQFHYLQSASMIV